MGRIIETKDLIGSEEVGGLLMREKRKGYKDMHTDLQSSEKKKVVIVWPVDPKDKDEVEI